MFSTFQILDYRISKNFQANPCGFIPENKKGPLKYVEPHRRGNYLKIASSLTFFKMSLFEIQSAFSCKASWVNLNP